MKILKIGTIIIFTTLSACATIPSESVSLSSELGNGIRRQNDAQIKLVNIYFESKRKDLDTALRRAIETYFSQIAATGSITLTTEQLKDVSEDIISFNTKNTTAKESLEKVRLDLVSEIQNNYLTLNQANASITGLLQSAVSVNESTDKSIQLVSSATDGKIDFNAIFNEINSFVLKGGEEAGKAIDLSKKIEEFGGK